MTNSVFKFVSAMALLVSLAYPLSGQKVLQLSLAEAKDYATRHNKVLENAGLAVDEAGMRLRETIAQGLPQINATVDYNNFFGSKSQLGNFPGFEIEFNPTSNLSLSVGQLIFSGSYIIGIQTARLFGELTKTSLKKSELETRMRVTQAYYLALVAKETNGIVEANLENIRELLKRTRTMVDVGVTQELDFDQLSVQASMLENAARATQRQVELAINMLRLQMGMPAQQEIELTDNLENILGTFNFRENIETPFSVENNLDYRLVSIQTDVAQKQVQMQRAAYLPTLSGFYNFTQKILKPEFDMQPKHVIGLNMSIPIFSSGVRQARVSQARLNLKVAENQRELVEQQLLIQEKQLRFNLKSALEQYESQQKNLEVARRVYNSFNNKFRQGMVSSLDITTANNNYLQAENGYISSLLQLLEAHLALETLIH